MLYRIGYITSWSLGLLYATFPHLFDGGMTFNFSKMSLIQAGEAYIFPLVMAMVLFLVDVIYGYIREMCDGQYTHVISVLIFLILFLLGFVFSMTFENQNVSFGCFIISWLSLSIMKFLKTDLYDVKKYPKGMRVSNN